MLLKNLRNSEDRKIHIVIENGKIAEILDANEPISKKFDNEKYVLDYEGKYVLSGIIDPHTHMRDPGLTQKEDFETGSKACAKGGITTFLDMPNTMPPVSTYELLLEKRNIVKNRSYVNYGLYFGGTKKDNSNEVKRLYEKEGRAWLKIFLNASTGDMLVEDDEVLVDLFKSSPSVFVHAEDKMAVKAMEISDLAKNNLYICHVATKFEIDAIRAEKERIKGEDRKLYAEVTPHHLFFTEEDVNKDETSKKLLQMKPGIKTKEDVKALWKALDDGIIDTIGTDHAPHLLEEKMAKTTFGIPGVEASLSLMLTAYKDGRISLKRVEELMSKNPAKIYGLEKKGEIKVGYDADLTIVEFTDFTFRREDVVSKCGWSPYEGFEMKGRAYSTIVCGQIVYEDGKFIDEKIGKEV